MSINHVSILHCIQLLNEKLDSSSIAIDPTTVRFTQETLDNLSKMEVTCPVEKIAIETLLSRVSKLDDIFMNTEVHEKVVTVVGHFFGQSYAQEDFKGPLCKDLLDKGAELESFFSKHPESREKLLLSAKPLIKEGTSRNDIFGILQHIICIPEEDRDSVCIATGFLLKEKTPKYDTPIIFLLNAVQKLKKEERIPICSSLKSIIKNINRAESIELLDMIQEILPEGKRTDLCLTALPFLTLLNKETETVNFLEEVDFFRLYIQTFLLLNKIPEQNRTEICSLALPILEDNGGRIFSAIRYLIPTFQNTPEKNKPQIFSCLKKIENYGNQSVKEFLRSLIFTHTKSEEYREALTLLASQKTKKGTVTEKLTSHKILPSIVPSDWIAAIITERSLTEKEASAIKDLESFFTQSKLELKGNSHHLMQPYMLTVISLYNMTDITPGRKLELLSCICKENELNRIKGFGLIRFLCGRNEKEILNRLPLESPIEELKQALEETLVTDPFINLSGIDALVSKYLAAFENTRIPFALDTYTAGLRTLQDPSVKNALESFVRSILLNTFESERYDVDKNPHLRRIQTYDQEHPSSNVLEKWKTLTYAEPIAPISGVSEEGIFSFEDFFKTKILQDKHSHLQEKGDQLPLLSSFLTANQEERTLLLAEINQNIVEGQRLFTSETSSDTKEEINQQIRLGQIQKICMELVLEPSLPKESQVAKIKSIPSITSHLELENDLKALANILGSTKKISALKSVELCKGWEDLLLAGTEVMGSCQRIDGDPNLNKCLLAYCLDGKNAMIGIKGPEGRIIARAMLRLLWNKTTSEPALFIDRLYSNHDSEEIETAILTAGKECAKAMELNLFSSYHESSSIPRIQIESLGSPCPYEYADGSDGVMPEGVFTIRNAVNIPL